MRACLWVCRVSGCVGGRWGGGGAGSQLFSLPDGGMHVLSVNVWDPGTVQDNPHSTEPCPPVIYIQSLTHVSSLKNIMQSSHGSTRWRPEGRQRGVWSTQRSIAISRCDVRALLWRATHLLDYSNFHGRLICMVLEAANNTLKCSIDAQKIRAIFFSWNRSAMLNEFYFLVKQRWSKANTWNAILYPSSWLFISPHDSRAVSAWRLLGPQNVFTHGCRARLGVFSPGVWLFIDARTSARLCLACSSDTLRLKVSLWLWGGQGPDRTRLEWPDQISVVLI